MKKRIFFIWSLLLITIGSFGSSKVYQQVITEQFRNEIAGIALNDSFPSADRFGNLYPGTVAQNIINVLNTDPSGVQLTKSEREYVIAIVSGLRPVWGKMKAVYGFVGGNEWKHKWNWKDMRDLDEAFRLTFLGGGWVHSSTGAKPNGTSSYANTFLNTTYLAFNNVHLSYYSNEDINLPGTRVLIGIGETPYSPGIAYIMLRSSANNNFNSIIGSENQTASLNSSTLSRKCFLIGTRISSTSNKLFYNGRQIAQNTANQNTPYPVGNIYLCAVSNNLNTDASQFESKQCVFSSIGDGLTDQQAMQTSQTIIFAQTILNRQ